MLPACTDFARSDPSFFRPFGSCRKMSDATDHDANHVQEMDELQSALLDSAELLVRPLVPAVDARVCSGDGVQHTVSPRRLEIWSRMRQCQWRVCCPLRLMESTRRPWAPRGTCHPRGSRRRKGLIAIVRVAYASRIWRARVQNVSGATHFLLIGAGIGAGKVPVSATRAMSKGDAYAPRPPIRNRIDIEINIAWSSSSASADVDTVAAADHVQGDPHMHIDFEFSQLYYDNYIY